MGVSKEAGNIFNLHQGRKRPMPYWFLPVYLGWKQHLFHVLPKWMLLCCCPRNAAGWHVLWGALGQVGGVVTALGLLASLQGMGYMPPPRPQEVGIGVNLEEFIVMQAPSSCYYLKNCQLPLLSTKACTYILWLLELLDRKNFSFSPN